MSGTILGAVCFRHYLSSIPITFSSRNFIRNLADFYLQLLVRGHGMLEFDALQEIVDKGYETAQAQVALWENGERFQYLQSLIHSL